MVGTETYRRYHDDGIAVVDRQVVPAALVDAAFAAATAVRAGRYGTGVPPTSVRGCGAGELCKIDNAHIADRDIHRLVSCREIGELAAATVGASMVQVFGTQLLIKPPTAGDAANVGWHQDRQYWQYWHEVDALFTAWVALSPVPEESGPVRFVRGSHKWGFLDSGDFFSHDNDALRDNIPVPGGYRWEEVSAVLPAGGLSVHHSLTYHGSGPNVSTAERVSVAIHMRTEVATPVVDYPNPYVTMQHLDDPKYCPVLYGKL